MTSAGKPGPADYDLTARLAARDIKVDPEALRRWRSEKWILPPEEDRGRRYSDAAEQYAARIVLTGRTSSYEAADDLLRLLGLGSMEADRWAGHGPILDRRDRLVSDMLLQVLGEYELTRYRRRLARTPMEQLIAARDEFA